MSDEDEKAKKRRRTLGSFPCPDCDKVFTRSDHLARHHLNHDPKEVFECRFIISHFGGEKRKCGKQFVRKDLRDRHMKRHLDPDPKTLTASKHSTDSKISSDQLSSDQRLPPEQQRSLSESSTSSPMSKIQKDAPSNVPLSAIGNREKNYENPHNIQTPVFPPNVPPSVSPLVTTPNGMNSALTSLHGYHRPSAPNEPLPQPQNFAWPEPYHQLIPPQLQPQLPSPGQFPLNSHIPYSQTDILSWLFTDSPPNAIPANEMSPGHQLRNEIFTSPIVASPLGGSQVSPFANNLIHQNQNVNHEQATADQLMNVNDPYRNYGFQDSNVFSTIENPLDEVFWRNYLDQLDGVARKARMASTASSSSPSNTAESGSSPDSSSTNSSRIGIKIHPFIEEHASRINTPHKKHLYIDTLILDLLLKCLPSITRASLKLTLQHTNVSFTVEDHLSFYLSVYWLIFHPQFSILHKPSFDTKNCEPPLLWAMIIVGCNYCHSAEAALDNKKTPERLLSDLVIPPMRYVIFEHEDFKTPIRLWILQSLNLIEWCEKNFLLRRMHERGHIHHGTNVQLLRRSPLLGGNPASKNKTGQTPGSTSSTGEDESDADAALNSSNDDTTDSDLFIKWLESESLKRITFMTFYLDIMDYIKFRHNPQIAFFQVQLLNLPCDDENLWESFEVNGSFRKIVKRQRKLQQQQRNHMPKKDSSLFRIKSGDSFLSVLKKLLRSGSNLKSWPVTKLSLFNRKLVFAGLVSLMYQMQQTELQNSWSLLASNHTKGAQSNNSLLQQWKITLTNAFEKWNTTVNGPCCQPSLKPPSKLFMNVLTTQCKYALFHLTQIIGMGDINHYDIAIFGGSPANMSVDASLKDQYIVQAKLKKMWQKNKNGTDLINLKGVIHCYILLWELMLGPSDYSFLDWHANQDYFDGMYATAIATLVLWSYVFSICGKESQVYNEEIGKLQTYADLSKISTEGGYEYLKRIRMVFDSKLEPKYDSTGQLKIDRCCEILPSIPKKNNISGLCFLVGTRLLESQWDVIRENAKLIIHCGFRSIGKTNATCSNLFENELD